MKSRSSISPRSNSIEGRFTSLNNNEMISLKGGDLPPLPPTGGEDYPIDLLNLRSVSTNYYVVQPLSVY